MKSGARGPGVFFIIPCVDHYEKIDMRTQTYDVPPQEVQTEWVKHGFILRSKTCKMRMLLNSKVIINHLYFHWVLVPETVEIEGNEFWQSKTFTPPEFIYPSN